MSDSDIPPKGSLEYIKYKRKLYNKKYQDKIKQKIESINESENNDEMEMLENPPPTPEQKDFFFQPKMKKTQKPQPQMEREIVLKMPETSVMTQVKNQLIMGSLTILPMLFTALYKRYATAQSDSSANQSKNQSNQHSETQQQLNFW